MSSTSSKQHPPSLPSTSSVNRTYKRPPPPISTVVTAPPWARDEPPSPKDNGSVHELPAETRASDVASLQSEQDSRWWTFTLPRTRIASTSSLRLDTIPKTERKGFRDLSLSWMPTSSTLKDGAFTRKEKDKEKDKEKTLEPPPPALTLTLPSPPEASFTLAYTGSPGWETPWTSRPAAQGPRRRRPGSYGFTEFDEEETSDHRQDRRPSRRQQLRAFILTNVYVPLLFRFINIAFTSAALGIAIRIRNIELKHNVMGAVGSSPTVVIIFAPLTLLHVMIAIYLEYFGRPLGLWRTSAKLTHTLSEVLFICAWSAALSLSFDNFFTSLIPCASYSATKWYNQLPRPDINIPGFEGSYGDRICDLQLSLICLVGVGVIAYTSNLIISLFRVFEKVKYHPSRPGEFPRPS